MERLQESLSGAEWYNAPPHWELKNDVLTLETGEKTDFWQDTYYGFHRDDGHFFGRDVVGDFTTVVGFEAEYETLYDQAGLMLRVDALNWVKAGIEFSDGVTNFSTVVTRNGRSDWSVISMPQVTGVQKIRLTRVAGAIITHGLDAHGKWHLMRLADFPEGGTAQVGPMACSPERAGLTVRFHTAELGPAIENPLHAT